MNTSTANMKSNFSSLYYPFDFYLIFVCFFLFSYVIRMKEFERERRLDEKAAKQASHAE